VTGDLVPLPLYGELQRATLQCGHSIPASRASDIWQECPHCDYEGLVIRWETVRD
jgi:hypothetical protein